MPVAYTPSTAWAGNFGTITNPQDGDGLTAASNNVGQSKLADFIARAWQMSRYLGCTWVNHGAAPTGSVRAYVATAQSGSRCILALCGNASTTTNIQASTDFGVSWNSLAAAFGTPLANTNALNGGFHDGTTWVVVGAAGTIYTTTTGTPDPGSNTTAWTLRTSGTANDLYSVTKSGSTWVAIGANSTILTSTDAVTWTARTAAATMTGTAGMRVIWNATAGLFMIGVAQGVTGGSSPTQTSPDGITWTARAMTGTGINTTAGFGIATADAASASIGVIPFGSGSIFVAAVNSTGTSTGWGWYSSTDGINWTAISGYAGSSSTIGWNGYAAHLFGQTGSLRYCSAWFDPTDTTKLVPFGGSSIPSVLASLPSLGLVMGLGAGVGQRSLQAPIS